MRMKRLIAEPETRKGNCGGCNQCPLTLYKIQGIYRYRCADCYEKETGHRHHLSPPNQGSHYRMLKLNHKERGIIIAALTEARRHWYDAAVRHRTEGQEKEGDRLAGDAVAARDLCSRFEEEQA